MRRILATAWLATLLWLPPLLLLAQEVPPSASTETPAPRESVPTWESRGSAFGVGLATTAILTATEPEAALARAALSTRRLHGNVGEALVSSQFHESGGWKSIPARSKVQGIDHIWMKFDKAGRPTGMIVGETKFRNSPQGRTKSGLQMSKGWIADRLRKRAIEMEKEAEQVARRYGEAKARPFRLRAQYLRAAADGRVSYRSELFRVDVKGNTVSVKVYRLGADGKPIGRATAIRPFQVAGRQKQVVLGELIREIRKQYPTLRPDEQRRMAEQIYTQAQTAEGAITAKKATLRLVGGTALTVAAAGILAGGFDAVAQLFSEGPLDWGRIGKMTGLGMGSAGLATGAQIGISQALRRSTTFHNKAVALGQRMGLLPARTLKLLSRGPGAFVGTVVFSYGGYLLGLYDLKEANRELAIGTAGVAAGFLTNLGLMGAAAAWGTASTGTAISSLSGAAAYNATMALYGGGTIAAGGGGVAVGCVVVGGVVVAATIIVAWAVKVGFEHHDKVKAWEEFASDIDFIRTRKIDHVGNPWTVQRAVAH